MSPSVQRSNMNSTYFSAPVLLSRQRHFGVSVSLFVCVSSPGLAPSCNRGKAAGVLKQEGGDATTRTLTADE